jgi:hypothetical protein
VCNLTPKTEAAKVRERRSRKRGGEREGGRERQKEEEEEKGIERGRGRIAVESSPFPLTAFPFAPFLSFLFAAAATSPPEIP